MLGHAVRRDAMMDHQLETTCDRCGTHHRVVESMPNRPFDPDDVARLDRSCAFVAAIGSRSADESPTTNTLVVSTAGATRLLRRATDHGWVVDRERDHREDEAPTTVGLEVFAEAAPGSRLPPADARTVLSLDE
jgi:hypothetical protein